MLCAHAALALRLRTVAWPEVTTPAYLWSRGMLMYRDIKFIHTPGLMGALAAAFLAFGASAGLLRVFALLGPLVAHGFLLGHTRRLPPGQRIVASGFFLALFYASDGNAVWPTVLMSALAIPIAIALARGRVPSAGLLIGFAVLMKQTAAYVLLLAAARLALEHRFRSAARLLLFGSLPFLAVTAVFALLGSGREMVRWTLRMPLVMRPLISTGLPGAFPLAMLLFAFLPATLEAFTEPEGEERDRASWLLLVAAGFAWMAYPRFQMLQTVAAVPCLALSAALFMSREARWRPRAATAFVALFAASRAATIAAGGDFDGKVLFWNDEPAFDELIGRLRKLPPGSKVYSQLWGNVLPRGGFLPPGGIYVHPWLDRYFPGEGLDAAIRKAAVRERAYVVGYRSSGATGEVVGPYRISPPPP
ncbi:MAG TPA: hypothetical protein VLO07_01260 [Thermoanaerobaculia bacterium]|nr:hypothetical protein [Thermoanaerobaculia bacterium]